MARKTLGQYAEEVRRRGGFSGLKKLYSDIKEGRVRIRDPNPPRDFLEYLSRPDYSLWAWTALALLAATLVTVLLSDAVPPLRYLRYVLGSVTVLFLPGYATIEALYPREEELSPLERLALSIGLSLAVVPLIGLALNYTPWGIRLGPVVAALTLYTTILVITASYRKYSSLKR